MNKNRIFDPITGMETCEKACNSMSIERDVTDPKVRMTPDVPTLSAMELDTTEDLNSVIETLNELGIHIYGDKDWDRIPIPDEDYIKCFADNVCVNNGLADLIKSGLERLRLIIK